MINKFIVSSIDCFDFNLKKILLIINLWKSINGDYHCVSLILPSLMKFLKISINQIWPPLKQGRKIDHRSGALDAHIPHA